MSLINEALKKAQKQRSLDVTAPPAAATGPLPPRVPKRAAPMPAQRLVIAGMVCVLFLLAAAGGAWFLFTEPEAAPAPAPAPRVAKAPDSPAPAPSTASPVPSVPAPATAAVAAVSPAPAPTVNTAPASVPPAAPVAGTPTSAPAPTPAVAAAMPTPEPALRPEPTVPGDILRIDLTSSRPFAPPDPKIAAAVDTMRVSGIRAQGSDPKVLMNDRVFRRNDLVDRALGLRLQDIAPDRLTFVDETGATYVKNF